MTQPTSEPVVERPATRLSEAGHNALRGAKASVLASSVMGGFMVAAHQAGVLQGPPPRKLMKKTLQLFGQSKLARGRRLDVATTVMHFGYGAGCGAVFGLAAPRFQTRGARGLLGLGFGAAVWAASYAAWIPALGLMPTPPKDQPLRPTVMVLAHLIFGALLGLGYRK